MRSASPGVFNGSIVMSPAPAFDLHSADAGPPQGD